MEPKEHFEDEHGKLSVSSEESNRRYDKGRSLLKNALDSTAFSLEHKKSESSLLKTSSSKGTCCCTKNKTILKYVLLMTLIFGLGLFVGRYDGGFEKEKKTLKDEKKSLLEPIEDEQQMMTEEQQQLLDEEKEYDDEEDEDEEEVPDWSTVSQDMIDADVEDDPVSTLDVYYEKPWLLDEEPETSNSLVYDRKLSMEHNMNMPLACNENLALATCSSFSTLVNNAVSTETLVVPCGECYEVDITDGSQLFLEYGLRIEGKLYFPSTASVTFRTKFIWVLGLLQMDTPDVDNQVKFSLYGDELQTFVSDMGPCSSVSGGCNMGSKVIAVTGGQVDIQGIENECPAWEKLWNVGPVETTPMELPCNTFQTSTRGTDCWTTDIIQLRGSCVDQGHRMYCPIEPTNAFVGSGTKEAIKFTSTAGSSNPGQSMTSSDIIHWSWGTDGRWLYFRPDQNITEINSMFITGDQLVVEKVVPDTVLYEIQVSPAAADCWKQGTEVLLTSHTREQDDQQVAVIESTNPTTGMIRFTSAINTPISVVDHPDFAVEVASLSRRIVFEADSDTSDDLIGGHLVVHHTSTSQHIEGVEIRNFGQQGRLGKYPLHFHMCGDSHGSIVKKNVVRESNQRCYVVHLTNHVTLEENVAYDSIGHCYFIEDGAEIENTFTRNLGSGIKIMPTERVSMLEASSGRDETDDRPHGFNGAAVFWISNPQNHFYGNVAAGGEVNGYWFETRGARQSMSLGTFKDNEVHSSGAMAFTVYNPGWRPNEEAIIDNIKVYRNKSDGAFLHVTKNLKFLAGLFADNGSKDVFITRGDNLVFDGTHFMGQTAFASRNCGSTKFGIQLDPFRLHETVRGHYNGEYRGTVVKDAYFENYSLADTGCSVSSAPMKFGDHQTFLEAYNAPNIIQDVQFDTQATLDACMPGSGIDDVQIEIASDIHGAFTGQQGFLVNPKFSSIITTGCQAYNSCLDFCSGSCLRTVSVVAGDASFSEDIVMIVTDDDTGIDLINIQRDIRGFPEPDPVANRFQDAYTVVLPKGNFKIRFESLSSGTKVWPGFAFPVFEAAPVSCTNYVVESDVTFDKPAAGRPECDELIHNGNFDSGAWGIEGWNGYTDNAVQYLSTSGMDGSGALATTQGTAWAKWPTQVIDASCLEAGMQYEVTVNYKITDSSYNEIHQNIIDDLPWARVKTGVFDTSDPSKKKLQHTSWTNVAYTANEPISGWRIMTAIWTISDTVASADVLEFHIYSGPDQAYLIIDNVSIQPVVGVRHRNARGLRG